MSCCRIFAANTRIKGAFVSSSGPHSPSMQGCRRRRKPEGKGRALGGFDWLKIAAYCARRDTDDPHEAKVVSIVSL